MNTRECDYRETFKEIVDRYPHVKGAIQLVNGDSKPKLHFGTLLSPPTQDEKSKFIQDFARQLQVSRDPLLLISHMKQYLKKNTTVRKQHTMNLFEKIL